MGSETLNDQGIPPAGMARLTRTADLLAGRNTVTIVAYGDSISELDRTPDWYGGASARERNWAQVLKARLADAFPDSKIECKPFAVGGQNTYEGLGRIDYLPAPAPDLVLIAFGANDCAYHYLLPVETSLALSTLIAALRARHEADVVVIGTAGDSPFHPQFRHLAETVEAQRAAAAELSAPFVDMRAAMLAATEGGKRWAEFHASEQDCHPNDAGHTVWAAAAYETIYASLSPGPHTA